MTLKFENMKMINDVFEFIEKNPDVLEMPLRELDTHLKDIVSKAFPNNAIALECADLLLLTKKGMAVSLKNKINPKIIERCWNALAKVRHYQQGKTNRKISRERKNDPAPKNTGFRAGQRAQADMEWARLLELAAGNTEKWAYVAQEPYLFRDLQNAINRSNGPRNREKWFREQLKRNPKIIPLVTTMLGVVTENRGILAQYQRESIPAVIPRATRPFREKKEPQTEYQKKENLAQAGKTPISTAQTLTHGPTWRGLNPKRRKKEIPGNGGAGNLPIRPPRAQSRTIRARQ